MAPWQGSVDTQRRSDSDNDSSGSQGRLIDDDWVNTVQYDTVEGLKLKGYGAVN